MKEFVDLRTEKEKAYDTVVKETAARYEFLMTQPHATPTRVMAYLSKELGITVMAVRNRLVRAGVYTPRKYGDKRA